MTSPEHTLTREQREDLTTRCQELLDWNRTGFLADGSLRKLAKTMPGIGAGQRLSIAESQTKSEAMAFVVANAHLSTIPPHEAEQDAVLAEREACERAAYTVPDYVTSGPNGIAEDEHGNALPGPPYDRGRYDAMLAIRARGATPQGGEKPADQKWVLRKRGLFYRPNNQGYTNNAAEAALYSEADAKRCAEERRGVEPPVTAHPLSEFVPSPDAQKPVEADGAEWLVWWDSLPRGRHSGRVVEEWLLRSPAALRSRSRTQPDSAKGD